MSGSRKMPTTKRVQYAALPYRRRGDSRTEVMLVTSRETGRWIIPKGWPQKRKKPHTSAAREAREEGRGCWKDRARSDRIILVREEVKERRSYRLRGPRVSPEGEPPKERMAGKGGAEVPVVLADEGLEGGDGTSLEQDYSQLPEAL